MANIAPLLATPQTAPQIPVNTTSGAGSDLSFGALLERTVSSGAADSQQPQATQISPRKNIARKAETEQTGVDTPPAQPESTAAQQNVSGLALSTEIDRHSLTPSSILSDLPEKSQNIQEILPSLFSGGAAGPDLSTVFSPELITTAVATTDDHSLTPPSILNIQPGKSRNIQGIQPSLFPEGAAGLDLPVSDPEHAAVAATLDRATTPLRTDVEVLPGARQDSFVQPAAETAIGRVTTPLTDVGTLPGARQGFSVQPAAETTIDRVTTPLTDVGAPPGARQESLVQPAVDIPPAAAEPEQSTSQAVSSGTGIKPDPERFAQLPVTGPTVTLVNANVFASPTPAKTATLTAESVASSIPKPVPADTTILAESPRNPAPAVMTDTAATAVTRSSNSTTPTDQVTPSQRYAVNDLTDNIAYVRADNVADNVTDESAATPVTPKITENTEPPVFIPKFSSVPGPGSAATAVLPQNSAITVTSGWQTSSLLSGTVDSSSSWEATTTVATTAPLHTDTAGEPLLSAQPLEMISSNETGTAPITRQPVQAGPLEHLAHLTPSFHVSTLVADDAGQAQVASPQTAMTPLLASFNQLTSLKTPVAETAEKTTPTQQDSLRQEVKDQFTAVKIETRDKGTDNQGQQTSQQPGQQNMATDSKVLTSPLSATGSNDQPSAFFQLNQGFMSQSLPQHTTVPPAPVTPPPGTPVADDFIFKQIAERFQINTRNQETQLNIKLHPAELGELRINLTMKEGSIRAHIVAQSGQVQEVLEKNMVRLKSILEGQGFAIEELLVSTKADNVGNFDLLQDQLSKRNTAGQQRNQRNDSTFDNTYESVVTAATDPASSVNITA